MNEAVSYLAVIPSPTQGVWHIGSLPLRAYALCILVGIIAACAITEVRLRKRGAPKWMVLDVAVWAVPFGIVGGRIYHLITSPDAYFGAGGDPMDAFAIWEGGLGIWGAVAGGGVGAMIACRRMGVPLTFFADALAPGLPVAQAIGRLGNWFNNELHGGPTDLPWALRVYRFDISTGQASRDAAGNPIELAGGPFHPTFLYELVWNLGVAGLVWLADRRWKLGMGRAFALYVMAYTVGRFWIEALRTDEAHIIVGMRVNNWVCILVFLGALMYFLRVQGPQQHIRLDADGRFEVVTADGEPIAMRASADTDSDTDTDESDGDGEPSSSERVGAPPGQAPDDSAGGGPHRRSDASAGAEQT